MMKYQKKFFLVIEFLRKVLYFEFFFSKFYVQNVNAKNVKDFLFSFFLFSGFGRTDESFFSIFDGLFLSACVTGICGQAREKVCSRCSMNLKFHVREHCMSCALEKIIIAEVSGLIQAWISNEYVIPHLHGAFFNLNSVICI